MGPVTIAGDGTLLRALAPPDYVPVIRIHSSQPAGTRVTDRALMARISLLGAAPDPLLSRVDRVFVGPRGLEVVLRNGPTLYFGDATRPDAKWSAAARVLADPGSAGAAYVDVRIPDRPAAEVPGAASFTAPGSPAAGSPAASATAGPGLTGAGTAGSPGSSAPGSATAAGGGSSTVDGPSPAPSQTGVNGP